MNSEFSDLRIVPLAPDQAGELSALLLADGPAYGGHFTPFPFDADSLASLLSAARRDRYWGIWLGAELVAFFMLRGFDEGYARPSFGVFVGKRHARRGLGALTVNFALAWCRSNDVSTVMLKVHPENRTARTLYLRAGFQPVELCPTSGQEILERRLA